MVRVGIEILLGEEGDLGRLGGRNEFALVRVGFKRGGGRVTHWANTRS